jgi:hypothetical protein
MFWRFFVCVGRCCELFLLRIGGETGWVLGGSRAAWSGGVVVRQSGSVVWWWEVFVVM